MIRRLVLFGASGDLTARYLMPALAILHQSGQLPDRFRIVGSPATTGTPSASDGISVRVSIAMPLPST
jgi:glucose-6-phosphate 1-dehydrogenase